MSPAEHTGKAPSARSAFVPSDVALRMEPGTAPTAVPRCHRGVHRVARAAVVPALDDHHDVTQSGQQAVAHGEAPLLRADPGGRLRHDDPVLRHPLPQPGVPARVGVVEPSGDHADGGRTGTACALVRRPVDPQREARDDADPGRRQVRAQLGRHADAIAGRGARADQRHGRSPVQRGGVAQAEHDRAGAAGRRSAVPAMTGAPP